MWDKVGTLGQTSNNILAGPNKEKSMGTFKNETSKNIIKLDETQ